MPDVRDPLGTLKAAVDELIAADPARFSDRETIKDLYRQLSRMEAAVARASAAFDAGRDREADRARAAAAGPAAATNVPNAQARRRARRGRAMRPMDWGEGAG